MKKLSQTYFRQVQTKPSRNQSPDFRSSNSIKPTRSPQNIEYILKQGERNMTPVKGDHTPKSQQHTAAPKYFVQNRSTQQHRSQIYETGNQTYNQSRYCHSCVGHCNCVHKVNNEEVVIELRRIITMINGAQVSTFEPEAQDIKKQTILLSQQNQRLVQLVERLKEKSQLKSSSIQQNLEGEIKILRQQMNHNLVEFERDKQQLYRTNKTLSSKVKSLEDKNQSLQKEVDEVRSLLRHQEDNDTLRDQQSRRRNNQEKLSLSMIKEQYNESIKTLRENIQFQLDNKIKDYQAELREYKIRIDILEERLRGCERVNDLNHRLADENSKLKRQQRQQTGRTTISQSKTTTVVVNSEEANKLRKEKQQMSDFIALLNKQIQQSKQFYEKQLNRLKSNQQLLSKQTQVRVQKLMQNYEQQIKILKRQAKSNNNNSTVCNHSGIQQQNIKLKEENEQQWQEVIKLRNQLAKYTAERTKLQAKVYEYENELSKLNHQISSDHLNFVAHTTLLQNQNSKLKKELQNTQSKVISQNPTQKQNQRLKEDLINKSKIIAHLTQIEKQKTQIENEYYVLKEKCQNLQEENVKKINDYNNLKAKCISIQSEYKYALNKQIEECKFTYQQQIRRLKQDNNKINSDLSRVRTQYSSFSTDLKNSRYNQIKSKDDKIYDLQLTIRNLSKIIEETQLKIQQLEGHIKKVSGQNQNLRNQISRSHTENQQSLKRVNQQWQRNIYLTKEQLSNQIMRLNKELKQKQSIEHELTIKMNSKFSRYRTESLRQQLQQLKRLVNEGNFERLQYELSRISQNYQRQLIRSQQKTMEIDSLTKQKCSLEQKISDLEKMRLVLQQKINILSGNIKIIEAELRQRKSLCENLLNQKLILEKENLMLKKVKLDRQSIEATKAKAREISLKIDKLLAMEEQRQHNFAQAVSSHSEVMEESITRKLS